uniref:Uncharacterized protein n=1 Tax=Cacopsylla melanoneura TaxID=428564 RepID=A0A8D8TY03_9HEMI
MYLQGNGRNGHHLNRVLKYSMRATDAGWTLDSFFSMNGNNLIQTVCPLHEDDSITADREQDSIHVRRKVNERSGNYTRHTLRSNGRINWQHCDYGRCYILCFT